MLHTDFAEPKYQGMSMQADKLYKKPSAHEGLITLTSLPLACLLDVN